MRSKAILFVLLTILSARVFAQITAQGQGGKTVLWSAVGIEQEIAKKLGSRSVLGYSRNSGLYSYNALKNLGIVTIRQEIDFRINQRLRFSLGLLYAERSYKDEFHPDYINEFRVYPKLENKFTIGSVVFSHYLRADFRKFYRPQFYQWHKPFELRGRYLMKMTVPLDHKDNNYFVAITEMLAATDEEIETDGRKVLGKFQFTENRTSVYYRHHFVQTNIWFDLGIMHQLWRDNTIGKFRHTSMLQLDVIIVNPFKKSR